MADLKISQLPVFTSAVPAVDAFAVVSGGTTKQITTNQVLGSGGTATLASATITGAATVGTTLGVTGVSTFAAGTALLPALTTTGDTNTGIYYPSADTFAVTTGGTERFRVDSTGLGIGASPTAKLDVFVASGGLVFHGSNSSDGGRGLFMSVANSGVGVGTGMLSTDGGSYSLLLGVNGSEKMRIDSSGNVGVGVTPSLEKLQVNGGIVLSPPATPATLATNGQLTVNATSNTNLRFSYRGSDGTTRVANLTLA